ncbi:MAG: nitronate monooxygenase [Lachnospiraceae bacterium]|nr:nitronate monooxygenase [Lachnospiraceae bacterium]
MNGIKIGNKTSRLPILQGGMGVGVSLHSLAGHIAKNGGIGVISTADIGYQEPDFEKDPTTANLRAIPAQLAAARKIAPDGIIGFNVMVALSDYDAIVKACVACHADVIISGAGLPMDLPKYVLGTDTKIAPIVSSARALALLIKKWKMKYDYTPDMVVIEGPKAGGHLGFHKEEIDSPDHSLETITREILELVRETESKTGKKIPVIAAGGIFDGQDIASFLKLGVDGVQMASRFVATDECDASEAYKLAYVHASEADITIIKSPVGMPGRAINNSLIQRVALAKEPITHCYNCIKTCHVKDAPYCITKALIDAVKGDLDNGLIFCGSNVGRINQIVPVADLMQQLADETEACLAN